MSKEKVHRARRSARWWKFSTLFFLSMTFCFCQQKSVEHFSSISNLFAKCRLKFRAAFSYQRVNIADIMFFSSRRSVEFSIDNLHLFAINLFSYWEYRLYFAFVSKTSAEIFLAFFFFFFFFIYSISKMSMKISIDVFLLSVNPIRICKVLSEVFWVTNLQKRTVFTQTLYFE